MAGKNHKAFSLFVIVFIWLFLPSKSFACDPTACMMMGKDQDILALGEVISLNGELAEVELAYHFPQSRQKRVFKLTLKDFDRFYYSPQEGRVEVGKKYLFSLKKEGDSYVPAWELYEVTGTDYTSAKLIEIDGMDAAFVQWFINSGGTDTRFGGIRDKGFVYKDGERIQIYPKENQDGDNSLPIWSRLVIMILVYLLY